MKRLALIALLLLPSADAALLTGMVGRGTASGGGDINDVPVLTLDIVDEVGGNTGTDSTHAWESVFLLNDGRIASFGTGNHNNEMTNAMRIIDVTTTPETSYNAFPWTYTGTMYSAGSNRNTTQHDNHPSIYVPTDNTHVKFNHGVFDFDTDTWIYGNRSPMTQTYDEYVNVDDHSTFALGASVNYNPANAWCTSVDKGYFYGMDGGGTSASNVNRLTVMEASGGAEPWKLNAPIDLTAQGVPNLHDQRNTAVCVGTTLYFGGTKDPDDSGDNNMGAEASNIGFYKLDVNNITTSAEELSAYPLPAEEGFPQMVYDSIRGFIVVLMVQGVFAYDPANDAGGWVDVTPANWVAATDFAGHHKGVYHATNNAIYFTFGAGFGEPYNYKWHKLVWQ